MKKAIISALATMAITAALSAPAMAATCDHIKAAGGPAYGGCELCETDPVNVRGYLCKVIIVHPSTDSFTLMDCTGNTWEYFGIEDTMPGDFYTIAVDTKNTATLDDDVILSLTYDRPDLFY